MARTNLCKVCGWAGERTEDGRKWVGANHNLCSECVKACPNCNGTGRKLASIRVGGFRCLVCNGKGTVAGAA